MATTQGLVPITRSFLSSYYDNYPFPTPSDDVSLLSSQIRSLSNDFLALSPPTEGERVLLEEADRRAPHKMDENMWKNREHMEEILFLLDKSRWPSYLQQEATPEDIELGSILSQVHDKVQKTLNSLMSFQAQNSERIFNTVMTYLPQDFRGTLIRQQKERSERNKQAEVDALVKSGGSIRDKYALLWKQQMDRRRQLAQLGSATGVYKTLVKYLVGVPQVLLDFIKQLNDDDGPMEEQRQRYGPPLYSLTSMVLIIHLFLSLSWGRFETKKLDMDETAALQKAIDVYTSEFERFINFISEVFANAPFFISAEEAGALEARKSDEYKEISVAAGKTHEGFEDHTHLLFNCGYTSQTWESVCSLLQCPPSFKDWRSATASLIATAESSSPIIHVWRAGLATTVYCIWRTRNKVTLMVDSLNSYIAWDFSLVQGTVNMDIGFSVECINPSGEKILILPYRRYESDQGNFCTCMVGNYRLIWDNSYSSFFKKVVRYKVDCIPPVVEPIQSTEVQE